MFEIFRVKKFKVGVNGGILIRMPLFLLTSKLESYPL